MVSPSKKRQIKGRVTSGCKGDRKGDKTGSKLSYKPLLNKKFYLDLKGYRGTSTITTDIHNLGGIVEEFFSREVNYVISTRCGQTAGGSSSEQQPSPSAVHTASPLTPQQPLSSLPSTSHDSPLNIDSPREDTGKKRVRTRAEVLIERACVRRQGTSDVLENARLWNVPVWPLTKLLKWLAVLKENDQYRPQKAQTSSASKNSLSSAPKVQRLKTPYIKTECFNRQYKPLYKELPVWPELNLSNPPGISPFAENKPNKVRQNPKTSSAHKDGHKEKQRMKDRRRGVKAKESGYCELCSINYANLRLHLQSDTHVAFVKNDKNYQHLDELISGNKTGCQIGETIHSGPTILVKEEPKDEDIEPNCVFPGSTQETSSFRPNIEQPADIPSKRCSPRLLASLCVTGSPALGGPVKPPECKVAAGPKIITSFDTNTQIQKVKPEPNEADACSTHVNKSKTNVPELATEASAPEDKVTLAAALVVSNVTSVPEVSEAYVPETTDTKAAVPGDTVPEALIPNSVVTEAAVPEDTVTKAFEPEAIEAAIPKEKATKASVPELTTEPSVVGKAVSETIILKTDRTETVLLKDIVTEASVPVATVPETTVVEAAVPGITDAEAVIPETAVAEAAVTDVTDIESAVPVAIVNDIVVPEGERKEITFKYPEKPGDISQVAAIPEVSALAHPQASLPNIEEENREMVRLIQEADGKIDSFCHKRSSRASKRLGSADFDALEIKPDPIPRSKRSTRTRRTSCRSDKSESEVSDSRSVADESLCCDMVDKTAKRGKPKIGEPLQEEAATQVSAKYNGDMSTDLVNGTHKVKGRRISRTNSDESDCSSVSRSNGNIDHNGEKVDFSVLLEISAADRKKFESKKAKIRRKTADWTLISETEQYYNEKEEIMRNKNRPDSDSESDESDNCAENNDSKSECSDFSDHTANHTRSRGKGRGKQGRTVDEDEDESKFIGKRVKDESQKMKSRRTLAGRTRKTRYDLTLLNDDDDDDENFFGFPVSTPLPQTPQSTSATGTSTQTRCKGKGNNLKHSPEQSSSSGKSGRKRLSDAERFLRDNREYYHFQETTERLRRSTSSSGEKEKYGNGDEPGAQRSKDYTGRKEETKSKDSPPPSSSTAYLTRTRQVACGTRRITRSAGGICIEPEEEKDADDDDKGRERETRRCRDRGVVKEKEKDSQKDDKDFMKEKERDSGKVSEREIKEEECRDKENQTGKEREMGRLRDRDVVRERDKPCVKEKDKQKETKEERGETLPKVKGDIGENQEVDGGSDTRLNDLYFSFEGVPENECWFQTYQRFIDGIAVNEFVYDEDPLKFVLPYEMPSEYIRDFISMKKSLLSKKRNDLADLVRKSPRCHASTLALFSDIIPTKKTKVTSTTKGGKTAILKIDEASSDGTSTPGADSTKMQHADNIESAEELALLALHIDHIIKAEIGSEDVCVASMQESEIKECDEPDMKKTPPKKRGKKKRSASGSKSERDIDPIVKELKLFESPFAHEVDPAFIASIPDEMKDFIPPENILARAAAEVVEDSCYCGCTDRGSCDEFSSADDNTEASSECVSLCDSETIDSSTTSEPKRSRSGKKRRKNLTGWPKAQKRRRTVAPLTSDDNDSAIGCDDLEPKKRGRRKKHNNFNFFEQTTAQKLAALAACDRRASPRKKASVLYMDTWPVRFRTQK